MADLLSVQQVAEELGIDPETVRIHCRRGSLPALKAAKVWRIERETLDDWLKSPTDQLVAQATTAKRLFATILKMDAEEIDLAFALIEAVKCEYRLKQHVQSEEDQP